MTEKILITNENCIAGSKKLKNGSVNLLICDPPFGIGESSFDKHYNRDNSLTIDGYVEAPRDYEKFTLDWMSEGNRILSSNGTFYIISGWNHLDDILTTARKLKLLTLNHCIWKFNFGVNTSKKFVTSHYHILRFSKNEKVVFNTYCRFGPQEKTSNGGSVLYQDLEDVFVINKDFAQGETKNKNKLPDELIRKLILYSSNPGDLVCDFFMGNFTTAKIALKLGRKVCGFELNKQSFDFWMPKLSEIKFGSEISSVDVVVPENQGKPITEEERKLMMEDFIYQIRTKKSTKKSAMEFLMKKYGRGRFSIIKIFENVDLSEIKTTNNASDEFFTTESK